MERQITVTFDFDNTLTKPEVQNYFQTLREEGFDVWILTSRFDDVHKHLYQTNPTNEDMYRLLEELDFPKHKVMFTNMQPKVNHIIGTDILWHLDDDDVDVRLINEHSKTVGIELKDDWLEVCEGVINNAL